jgi:DNA-binding MarR family transcriptional regulator
MEIAEGLAVEELALRLAGDLEQVLGLFRSLVQPSALSMTASATLATLERNGPCRLTALATREGVTQPAMTQLVSRLQDAGLVCREADPADGRVVRVSITDAGKSMLARRRAKRAEGLAGVLDRLSAEHRAALA